MLKSNKLYLLKFLGVLGRALRVVGPTKTVISVFKFYRNSNPIYVILNYFVSVWFRLVETNPLRAAALGVVLLLQKPIQETPICLCLELVSADVQ